MKKTIKLIVAMRSIAIIALVAVIGFSFAACGGSDDSSDGGSGGGGSISGGNTISGATIKYHPGIKNLDEAKMATDFSFYGKNNSLSGFLNNPASVTISSGKLDMILGVPKPKTMEEAWGWFSYKEGESDCVGLTVEPSDAKLLGIFGFTSVDEKYILFCAREDFSGHAALFYADKDVTIKGKSIWSYVPDDVSYHCDINISLKKGWNYVLPDRRQPGKERSDISTASTKIPDGCHWTVIDEDTYDQLDSD